MKCTSSEVDALEAVINVFFHQFGTWSFQSLDYIKRAMWSHFLFIPFYFFIYLTFSELFSIYFSCSGECYDTVLL